MDTKCSTDCNGRWPGACPATCHRRYNSGYTGNGASRSSPPTCASGRTTVPVQASGNNSSDRRRNCRGAQLLVMRRRGWIARWLHQSSIRSYPGRGRNSSSRNGLSGCGWRCGTSGCRRGGSLLRTKTGRSVARHVSRHIVDWNAT